mgnify:CR=1 FL=1
MSRRGLTELSILLTLLPVALPVTAENATGTSGFHYSEDWAVVSAPPPPGPYRAVNLDPRIPGQDVLPLLPLKQSAGTAVTEAPVEIPADVLEAAPAAGKPAMSETDDSPAADLGRGAAALPPPVPGRYNRMVPAQNYSATPRYPAPGGYSGYRNMPPPGYYGAQDWRNSQQVPPPPVYDAMMKERQAYGEGTP